MVLTPLFDNEWFFVCVPSGESLSTAIGELQLNRKNWWINNAYSYIGIDYETITDENDIRALGTSSITWNSFAHNMHRINHKKYEYWSTNGFETEYFDMTPYKDHIISGANWGCWVQLTNEKVDIDVYYSPEAIVNVSNQGESNRFTTDGWYCIGVNTGESINDIFYGELYNDETIDEYKHHRIYKLNNAYKLDNNSYSLHTTSSSLDIDLMKEERYNYNSYWMDITNEINSIQSEPVAMWVNITKSEYNAFVDSYTVGEITLTNNSRFKDMKIEFTDQSNYPVPYLIGTNGDDTKCDWILGGHTFDNDKNSPFFDNMNIKKLRNNGFILTHENNRYRYLSNSGNSITIGNYKMYEKHIIWELEPVGDQRYRIKNSRNTRNASESRYLSLTIYENASLSYNTLESLPEANSDQHVYIRYNETH